MRFFDYLYTILFGLLFSMCVKSCKDSANLASHVCNCVDVSAQSCKCKPSAPAINLDEMKDQLALMLNEKVSKDEALDAVKEFDRRVGALEKKKSPSLKLPPDLVKRIESIEKWQEKAGAIERRANGELWWVELK